MLIIIWIVIVILERNKKKVVSRLCFWLRPFFICGVSIKVKEQRFYDSCLHQITWGERHDLGPFVCQLNRTLLCSVTLPCPNLQVNWKERSPFAFLFWYHTGQQRSRAGEYFFSRLIKWDINSLQMAHSSPSINMISKLAQKCLHSRPDCVS